MHSMAQSHQNSQCMKKSFSPQAIRALNNDQRAWLPAFNLWIINRAHIAFCGQFSCICPAHTFWDCISSELQQLASHFFFTEHWHTLHIWYSLDILLLLKFLLLGNLQPAAASFPVHVIMEHFLKSTILEKVYKTFKNEDGEEILRTDIWKHHYAAIVQSFKTTNRLHLKLESAHV